MQLVLDLNIEGVARPGLRDRLACIPLAQGRIANLCNERDDMEPGQLVSRLLTNYSIRAFRGSTLGFISEVSSLDIPVLDLLRGGGPTHRGRY